MTEDRQIMQVVPMSTVVPQGTDATLEYIAKKAVEMGLAVPVTIFLELHKPFTNLFHTLCLILTPMACPLLGSERLSRFSNIFTDPSNIENLLCKIERLSRLSTTGANK